MYIYTEVTERTTIVGGDDSVRGFPLSAYFCISLQTPPSYVIKPKALVTSEGCSNRVFTLGLWAVREETYGKSSGVVVNVVLLEGEMVTHCK
jgi:hypothetical protein